MGATADFFDGLAERGHEPLLEKSSGTLLFELTNGKQTERWHVSVDKGEITVSNKSGKADCTVKTKKRLFDEIATGKANALAALLRGAIDVEGEPSLLARFQRLFPGPPRAGATPSRGAKR